MRVGDPMAGRQAPGTPPPPPPSAVPFLPPPPPQTSVRSSYNYKAGNKVNPFPTPEICMAAHLAVATARRP